jgi:hypothetical protein
MMDWLKRERVRQLILLLVIVISLSFSIVYTDVRTFDTQLIVTNGYSDTASYLDMYFGKRGNLIGTHRPLVPFLARLIPDLPFYLFPSSSPVDPLMMAAIKFGLVNLFFLIATCLALYALERRLQLSFFEAFLGVILFLSSTTVVRSAGLALTDTAFFFFFTLGIIAIQQNNLLLLMLVQAVGVLAKELVIILIGALILLSSFSWRRKGLMLLTVLPAIVLYKVVAYPIGSPLSIAGWIISKAPLSLQEQLLAIVTPRGLVKLFFSFGLAWIPAIYALVVCKVPLLLRRWSWLILIVFLGDLFFLGNFDRTTFNAFPVVIPLAALGLSKWLFSIPARTEQASPPQ